MKAWEIRSPAERDVRDKLARLDGYADDYDVNGVTIGMLRSMLADLDMWREITANEIDKWSFDALVAMAKRILDAHYPDTVFKGQLPIDTVARTIAEHAHVTKSGDNVAVGGLDVAAIAVVELLWQRNSGVHLVAFLRKIIGEIEMSPTRERPPTFRREQPDILGATTRMVERFDK